MAKESGLGDRCYVDGFNISGDVGSLSSIHGGPNPGDVTAIDKGAFERIGLLIDGGISFSSWFNSDNVSAIKGSHQVLKTLPTADRVVTYGHTAVLGAPAATLVSKQVNYDGSRGQDGSYSHTVDASANAYGLLWGEQLTPGPKTDTTATNGTGIDFGAVSTLFGAYAALHVFSVTGTSVTVKVQDSADNVTFADVTGLTFAAVLAGANGAQFLATSATATVRRYVRAISTGTFSNAQFAVNFVRNLTAVAL